MTDPGLESTIIDKALAFYQQYLVSERQRTETGLRRNGKSAATPEDFVREHACELELQTIAAILEKRKRASQPLLETAPSPGQQKDGDAYLNPFTDQYVVPESKFRIGPLNTSTIPNRNERMKSAGSTTIFADHSPHYDAEAAVLAPTSSSSYQNFGSSTIQDSSNTSKATSTSIKRASVDSTQTTDPPFLPPEQFMPSKPPKPPTLSGVALVTNTNPAVPNRFNLGPAVLGQERKNEPNGLLDEHNVQSPRANHSEPNPMPVGRRSIEPFHSPHAEQQNLHALASFNDVGTPWGNTVGSTATGPGIGLSSITPTHNLSREPSWQSATWSHVMSVAQKPGTPLSVGSKQSQDHSWSLVPPRPTAKMPVPGGMSAFQQAPDPSRWSPSSEGVDNRSNSSLGRNFARSSSSLAPPNEAANKPQAMFRQQPTFNMAELGKFPGSGGNRLPFDKGRFGRSPSQNRVGNIFGPSESSEEFGQRPEALPSNQSGGPNPFSLPIIQGNVSVPGNTSLKSSVALNGPRQQFWSSKQQSFPDQTSAVNSNAIATTRENPVTLFADIKDALGMASRIAQRSLSSNTNDDFSPKPASVNHSSCGEHIGSTRQPRDAFLGGNFSSKTAQSNWSTLPIVEPFNQEHGLSNSPSQSPREGPNEFLVDQQRPNILGSNGHVNSSRVPPSATSQGHRAFGSWQSQDGLVPNQLRPLQSKPNHRLSSSRDSDQGIRKDWFLDHDESTGSSFQSQMDEDSRMAQAVADSADRAEREALQQIQDEFNREDDAQQRPQQTLTRRGQDDWSNSPRLDIGLHESNYPLSLQQRRWQDQVDGTRATKRDPPQWRPSGGDPNASVEFAASPDPDEVPHPPVVVKAPKSTSLKPPRPTQQGNFDAVKAAEEEIRKYDAAQRARETKERQARLEKDKADRAAAKAPSNEAECTACTDPVDQAQLVKLPCTHAYHGDCIAKAFKHALAAGKVFTCCDKTPAPVEPVAPFLPADFTARYQAKMLERATPNPIYCARPGCATFVPASSLKGDMATCPTCHFVSCRLCKNPEHRGTCPPDRNGKRLLDLAGHQNWTQCKRCNVVVERDEGCLHMTCTCGHEFCYNCGAKWDQCGGSCPRK